MRKTMIALALAAAAWAQTAAAPGWKEFSIGPPTRNQAGRGPDGIRAEGIPLKRALAWAYGLPEHRIVGPDWLATDRYALTAIPSNPGDLQPLLQQELTSRFQMVARREKKDVPVYVLKSIEGTPVAAKSTSAARGQELRMPRATLTSFANALADVILRPVFDETGIEGTFEINLSWKQGNAASLQTAVKDQLGLQLTEDKRVVDLVYIDRIEKLRF